MKDKEKDNDNDNDIDKDKDKNCDEVQNNLPPPCRLHLPCWTIKEIRVLTRSQEVESTFLPERKKALLSGRLITNICSTELFENWFLISSHQRIFNPSKPGLPVCQNRIYHLAAIVSFANDPAVSKCFYNARLPKGTNTCRALPAFARLCTYWNSSYRHHICF